MRRTLKHYGGTHKTGANRKTYHIWDLETEHHNDVNSTSVNF